MHKVNLKDRVLFITVSCLVIFCIALLSWERTFDTYELHTLDFRFKIRPTPEISDKISIIEISDDSIKAIGSWPFDRIYHAGLVKALKYAGAK